MYEPLGPEGRNLVRDWMYELRLFALEQLSGIGGDLFLANAHPIIVTGPNKLREAGRTIAVTCGRGCPSSPRAMTAEGQVA